jgi:hypothetical protein
MQTRSKTRHTQDLISLHQLDVDISGPFARSHHVERERELAEDQLTSDNDATGSQEQRLGLNPDSTTNTKRPLPSDLSDSPEWAKLAKTGAHNSLRTYVRTLRAHSVKKNKNGFLSYLPRAIKYTSEQFGTPLINKLKKIDAADFDTTKPGFVARDYEKDAEHLGKVYSVQELLSRKFSLIAWSGRFVNFFR